MSMLMGQAAVTLKSVVGNIDKFLIVPTLRSLFDWNMQWNPDESIKGDMKVVAKGITSLLAKEVQSQRLMQFAQIASGFTEIPIVNWQGLVREIAKSLDLDAEKILIDEQSLIPPEQATPQQGGGGETPPTGQPSPMGSIGDLPDPAAGGL